MFTLTCPECRAEVSLPARRLLVRVDAGRATAGELLFTCLGCQATPAVPLAVDTVASLTLSGVTFVSLSEPVVEHPESRTDGPALTHDDLLDLHAQLDSDAWFDELVGPEC